MKYDIWKREEDLENVKEVVVEFEGRINNKKSWIWWRKKTLEEENYWRSIQQRYCVDRMINSLK